MKRVAIIVSRLAQLGPVNVLQALVNRIVSFEGVEVSVFYLDKEVDPLVKIKVPVARYEQRSFCFADYDIIHTSGIRPDLIAFMNRRKIRYHISTIHNYVFADLRFTYNRLTSWIFGNLWLIIWKSADKLVCVSGSLKQYYSKWFPQANLEVIHNGIPEPDSSIETDAGIVKVIRALRSRNLRIIGCAGQLSKRKGIDLALHMAAGHQDMALIVIGEGKKMASLIRLAEKLGITERTVFARFKTGAVNYFKFFDFFLMPSRSEGFGLALVEAVSQKIPVICSDLAVFRELFTDDEVTFFSIEDKTSLDKAYSTVKMSGSTKAEEAFNKFKHNYTDLIMANRYYNLYLSI